MGAAHVVVDFFWPLFPYTESFRFRFHDTLQLLSTLKVGDRSIALRSSLSLLQSSSDLQELY